MALYKRSRTKDASAAGAPGRRRKLLPLALLILLAALFLLVFLLRDAVLSPRYSFATTHSKEEAEAATVKEQQRHRPQSLSSLRLKLPKQSPGSISLEKRNKLPPRNVHLFPNLAADHIKIVLYVHNRPQYLGIVVRSLSQVEGISETLLIVSHDGHFPEMDSIVQSIAFCQVKQIYAPFSPHLFPESFPGMSAGDCRDKDDPAVNNCVGNPDQYGNHRSPKIVSLKHHWWWMMNTVWDGLGETKGYSGHVLFIEEDHFVYPNAYRNLQLLLKLKPDKCPECYAANLAPADVNYRGEEWESLIAEKIGNIGYTFNRTVWRKIHGKAKEFCTFDEYNWDITMWAAVYPSFGTPVYTLRGSRTSAAHFGKCGLHQGRQGDNTNAGCIDNGQYNLQLLEIDKVPNIKSEWRVHYFRKQSGYQAGFRGWGGWGDQRDRDLCSSFAFMYHQTIEA